MGIYSTIPTSQCTIENSNLVTPDDHKNNRNASNIKSHPTMAEDIIVKNPSFLPNDRLQDKNNLSKTKVPSSKGVVLSKLVLTDIYSHDAQNRQCTVIGCHEAVVRNSRCNVHLHQRQCVFPGCQSTARSRGRCYAHGGGRRCKITDCQNGAVSKDLCKRHGGGKRCTLTNCDRSAESRGLCYAHGGGRRCSVQKCPAGVRRGSTLCANHYNVYSRNKLKNKKVYFTSKEIPENAASNIKCGVVNCIEFAESRGLCKSHGGGGRKCCITHCRFRVIHGSKYCHNHVCSVASCSALVRSRGRCAIHGGDRKVYKVPYRSFRGTRVGMTNIIEETDCVEIENDSCHMKQIIDPLSSITSLAASFLLDLSKGTSQVKQKEKKHLQAISVNPNLMESHQPRSLSLYDILNEEIF